MDWQKGRQSDNVVEDDGSGGGGGGGGLQFGGFHIGIGGIILIVIVSLLFGKNPLDILSMLSGGRTAAADRAAGAAAGRHAVDRDRPTAPVRALGARQHRGCLGCVFPGQRTTQYEQPKLLLFHGRDAFGLRRGVRVDGTVLLSRRPSRLSRPGLLPRNGHALPRAGRLRARLRDRARGRPSRAEPARHHEQGRAGARGGQPMEGADGLSVRLELQADCFAGVWANRSQAAAATGCNQATSMRR